MCLRVLSLTIVGLALCGRVTAAPLGIGSPAPRIEVKEFIKGEPVNSFETGKIYVVEFWATWCPPCRTTIPHLTEMQKKYKNVVFIGVSVFENNWSAVKPFVKEMGEKMAYRVAMDDVGNGMGREGKMSRNWMSAAAQGGIPTAFIVNGEGKIAWIGHPMQMEKTLGLVVAGNQSAASPAPIAAPESPVVTEKPPVVTEKPPVVTEKPPPPKKVEPKTNVEPTPRVESQLDSTPPPPEQKSKLPWIIAVIVLIGGGGACLVFAIVSRKTRDSEDDEDERPRKKRKKESDIGDNGKKKPLTKAKRILAEED